MRRGVYVGGYRVAVVYVRGDLHPCSKCGGVARAHYATMLRDRTM